MIETNLLHVSANGGILAVFGQSEEGRAPRNGLTVCIQSWKIQQAGLLHFSLTFNVFNNLGFEIQNNHTNRIEGLPVSFQTSSSEYVLTLFGNNHTAAAYVNRQWVICEAETGGENGFTIV